MNYPAQWMQDFYNQTYHKRNNINIDRGLLMFLWGLTVTFFPIGGLIGTLLARPLADHCGRKHILLVNNAFSIVAAVLSCCSKAVHSYELVIFARLLIGICAGIACNVVPMYLGEMSPHNLRGAVIVVAHFFITFGILVGQALSLHNVLGTRKGWPMLLFFTGIPALFQLSLLPQFPESPRYLLIQKGDEEEARKALREVRQREDVEDEIEELKMEDDFEKPEKQMSMCKLVLCLNQHPQLLSIVVMTLSQHLSGLNTIHYYAEKIYLSTGVQEDYVRYISMMISGAVIFITIITIFVVDSSGRRVLLLTGFGICSVSCILLAMALELQSNLAWMSYFSTAFIIVYVIGHSIGPSPIPRVMIADMFLQSSRASAFMVGETVHWVIHFLLDMLFLHIKVGIEPYSFIVLFLICMFTYTYIFKMVPETKKKSFVEIRKVMNHHVGQSSPMKM
ncbi:solute carrier family 2, facilitated glucose transporter member 5-like [Sphaerodactylus townsendi]|uniref:solute carrier family 2, facilitated glucose transporter member 5-like n=1 Tax=Sphaerodactylus townsendi TaxID=933632 RepID=UPI0020267232|nr:solute carrier family 2, facilitated glucose transporter member 5-like [Sphaerodactylus townsendi]